MSDSSPPDSLKSPRILVALPEGPVRERVLALLADRDVDVITREPSGDLAGALEAADADVVVVRHSDIESADAGLLDEAARDDSAPDVVVLGRELDTSEHVDLVTAGAAEVIDVTELDASAAQGLTLLATGEGGHGAPDSSRGPQPSLSDFASRSKVMHALLDLVERVAPSDATLLLTGPTGVGKEHLARAIHAASPRAAGPFVAVNCGALPAELLESELFGHREGAFTGAEKERKGAFASAEGGTILLDEIGEMPTHMQVKLLRVLQRSEVRPVGSDEDTHVDVRVLAATNRDLRADMDEGRFREDLYFRLNVVELRIPPLSERAEDLPTLIGSLIRHFRAGTGMDSEVQLSAGALEKLLQHDWPGNVRELANVVERAVLVSRGELIEVGDLPPDLGGGAGVSDASGGVLESLPPAVQALPWKEARVAVLAAAERAYLDSVLRECEGVIGAAAERAGLSARSLYEKMKRHGLDKGAYR